ncbi:Hypothetical protein A7982_00012 [Minicystis rosea]|nr:Hypothetical protein A7982_00012 [Minicystis rosea]
MHVQIAEESALIVWDAQQRREHFIRRAALRTTGKDFGSPAIPGRYRRRDTFERAQAPASAHSALHSTLPIREVLPPYSKRFAPSGSPLPGWWSGE